MTTAESVETGSVLTEGDELYFEMRGSGEPLLMIPGGIGEAGHFSRIAPILAERYRVIAYDRRGNSRSTRRDPQNFEIGQQGRDAAAVLAAAGYDRGWVFGNSGGAIIGLELARFRPDVIRGMVVHEPPALRVLPDADNWLAKYAAFFLHARRGHPLEAMEQFVATTVIAGVYPEPVYEHIPLDFAARIPGNREFFVLNEMIPISSYKPDIQTIRANNVPVVVAVSEETIGASMYYGRTGQIVAEQLGCECVTFPGHHMSYMDMPELWAAAICAAFDGLAG